ncbi:MAG: hypothetical protein JST39_21490 [Bacteroidetes bacterium]|nr:hypothetical protein [Bacteroidota bacterium]
MQTKTNTQTTTADEALQTIDCFFTSFSAQEADRRLHMMLRAALAQEKTLRKKDILSLLFLKEEMTYLIPAAHTLSKEHKDERLKRLFKKKTVAEWTEWLDELFHAAVYDGFFICSTEEKDVYGSWKGLRQMLKYCYMIHAAEKA